MSMTLETFVEGIRLPKEGCDAVFQMERTCSKYEEIRRAFDRDGTEFDSFLEKFCEEAGLCRETVLLWSYCRMAAEVYDSYQRDGISDRIYFDTFHDFSIWYEHCMRERKIPGLVQGKWLSLPIRRKIYRLGRLQFEPGILPEQEAERLPERKSGSLPDASGEVKALHVHIPEGEKLDPLACRRSFQEAERFFGAEYGWFDCLSWLLAPALGQMLGGDSNILRFQQMFDIQYTVYTDRQAEERVFGRVLDRVEDYPETTGLQKSLKQYVKEHGNPGIGYGIRRREEI